MATPATAKVLDQYATPTEVSKVLGISRQAVNVMMHKGDFKSLYVLPGTEEGERSRQYLVSRKEMQRIAQERVEEDT